DDMADNTCHYGVNNLFADGGIEEADHHTMVYFPGDPNQFAACVKRVFHDPGLRFVFSNRSKIPFILKEDGSKFYGDDFVFTPGKDDLVREGDGSGYIVSYGSCLYRSVAAAEELKAQGINVGVVSKATLNKYDAAMMAKLASAKWVLVAEEFNEKTGLGSRFGSALLKAGFTGKYNHIGIHREGPTGLWQQMGYHGIDPEGIANAVKALA
ncbi:MAG: transketolase C-terminal domain-containing protein, partial [Planctomycetota bacterium]